MFTFSLSSQLIIIQFFAHHILESLVYDCQNPYRLDTLYLCYVTHAGSYFRNMQEILYVPT